MEQIKRLFKNLENEVSSERFIKLYQKIRQKYPPIKSYLTPEELIYCLHNQNKPDYILNDKILSSLILEHQTQPSPKLIGAYLLILFKPGLFKIFFQFRKRARQFPSLSDIDLWLQIVTLFFEELNNIDLNKDRTKIASKILGRLKNHLRDYFSRLFKILIAEGELKANPKAMPSMPIQVNFKEIEGFLQNLVNLGIISEADKYILLATKVYGKSMRNVSQQLKGISYENIRQRKVRAEKKIRKHIHKKSVKGEDKC